MKKFFKSQKGFSLIELLVVIAILGVLAAIAVPNVSRFLGVGKAEAASTELSNVQASVDQMMVDTKVSTLTVGVTVATNNMAVFPVAVAGKEQPLYPNYMRDSLTKGTYTLATNGLVTQATTGY